jgi:hypothetical protein
MTKEQDKAIDLLAEASTLLGWHIAFETDTEDVSYIIIAKPELLNELVKKIENKNA